MTTRNNIKKLDRSQWLNWIFPVAILVLAALFVLCSSPIYKSDTFDDVNAMLTIGRSVLHGAVPLKTLIDQRGPVIYALYTIAALISSNSFFGVWIIEVINVVIIYFISVKIANDFELKDANWLGLLGPIVLLGTSPIYGGGSPEEFAFTSVLYLLEVVIRCHGDLSKVSMNSFFWVALNMSLVFWSKYSLIGAFIVFFIWAACSCIDRFDYKRLGQIIGYSFVGFMIVTALICIYYFLVGGIGDLFKTYFIDNITMYNVGPNGTFLSGLIGKVVVFGQALLLHPVFLLILIIGVVVALYRGNRISVLAGTLIGDMLLVAYSGETGEIKSFPCPFLIFMPFLVVALLQIIQFLAEGKLFKSSKAKYSIVFNVFMVLGLFIMPFMNNLYLNTTDPMVRSTTMTLHSRTALNGNRYEAQPNFGRIMKEKSAHPTMLMMDSLDEGFFLTSGAIPTTTYWQQLNMPQNSTMFDSFYNTLSNKKVQFVVVRMHGVFTRKRSTIKKIMTRQMLNYAVAINRGPVNDNIKDKIMRNSHELLKNYHIIDSDGNNPVGISGKTIVPYYVLLERN